MTAAPTHVHRGIATSSGLGRPSIGLAKADPWQASPAKCSESTPPHIRLRPFGELGRQASSPRRSPSRLACSCQGLRRQGEQRTPARSRTRAAPASRARRSAMVSLPATGAHRRSARRRTSAQPRKDIGPPTTPPRAPARARVPAREPAPRRTAPESELPSPEVMGADTAAEQAEPSGEAPGEPGERRLGRQRRLRRGRSLLHQARQRLHRTWQRLGRTG